MPNWKGRQAERKADWGRDLKGWSKGPERGQQSNQGRTVNFGFPLLSNMDFHMAEVKLKFKVEECLGMEEIFQYFHVWLVKTFGKCF